MAIAFRSGSYSGEDVFTDSLTVDTPSGVQDGDILIVVLDREGESWTLPSGWTLIADKVDYNGTSWTTCGWHRAGPSEPSSYTFNLSGNAYRLGAIGAYSGCVTSGSPIDFDIQTAADNNTAPVGVAIRTSWNGSMRIVAESNYDWSNIVVGTSGMTQGPQVNGCEQFYATQSIAGTSDDMPLPVQPGVGLTAGSWSTIHFALIPARSSDTKGILSTGSQAGLSFGRLVSDAWSGVVWQLRRGSDDAVQWFSPNGSGELDAAAVTSWAGGDCYYQQVLDVSGHGAHAAQYVNSHQPDVITSGGPNSHCAAVFTGGQWMNVVLATAITSAPLALAVAGAVDFGTTESYGRIVVLHPTGAGEDDTNGLMCLLLDGSGAVRTLELDNGTFTTNGIAAADDVWKLFSVAYGAGTAEFFDNGVSVAAAESYYIYLNASNLLIGAGAAPGADSGQFGGQIGEIILENSLSNLSTINANMLTYWMAALTAVTSKSLALLGVG